MIAGLGARFEIFGPTAEYLDGSYVLVDPLGFGYRNPRDHGVSLTDAADHLLKSEKLPDRPRIYVGHSAGALEAVELALADPKAVGLVMVNGLLDEISKVFNHPLRYMWRYPRKTLYIVNLLIYIHGWMPEFILRRMQQPGHPLTRLFRLVVAKPGELSSKALQTLVRDNRCPSALSQLLANRHYDMVSQAGKIGVPLLTVTGSQDRLTTPAFRSKFLKACPDHPKVVTWDAGHCIPAEMPLELAEELTKFRELLGQS
jgi:pimeloyl-ACP methyl ester carboxylesterase